MVPVQSQDNSAEESVQLSISIALCVAFLTGCALFLIALMQLGESVQRYLSPALVGGFHTGAVIHIMVSQLSHVLGVPAPSHITGTFQIPRKIVYYGNMVSCVLVFASSDTLCGDFIVPVKHSLGGD